MAEAWHAFDAPLLLLLSGQDFTAREFIKYASADPARVQAFEHPNMQRRDLRDAGSSTACARGCG